MKECPVCGFDPLYGVEATDAARSLLLIAVDELAQMATRVRMMSQTASTQALLEDEGQRELLRTFARSAEREAQVLAGYAFRVCPGARPLSSDANGDAAG